MNLSHAFRIVIALLLVAPLTVNAATSFTYQGKLLQGGAPADGTYHLRFQLWSALAAGAQVGSTIDLPTVNVADGFFTVDLNFGTPATIFNGADRWLQVAVITNGGATVTTLAPRQPLAPAPYAFFALNSGAINIANFPTGGNWALSSGLNVDSGTFNVDAANNRIGIGTTAPQAQLHVTGDLLAGVTGQEWMFHTRSSFGGDFLHITDLDGGVPQFQRGLALTQAGNVGIGTTGPENTLHVHKGSAGAMTGWAYAPLIVESNDHTYINIVSPATQEQGILFGNPTDGAATGGIIYDNASNPNGLQFRTNGNINRMIIDASGDIRIGTTLNSGRLTVQQPSGGSHGVSSEIAGPSGFGSAIYGSTNSTGGTGIYGRAFASSGSTYGVYGQTNSPSGYGVYSQGRFAATGTKAFRIDHPDDPENKYLLHYSIESSEVLNSYSGKVTLDAAGEAVVDLPHYFAKINAGPRYTLTAIGTAMPNLHIAEEIDETALEIGARAEPGEAAPLCSFRIAGGAHGAKVSWRVEAVRNDKWMQQRGAPVEAEKPEHERGLYQHPELYGQPPEKGMNYRPRHAASSATVTAAGD